MPCRQDTAGCRLVLSTIALVAINASIENTASMTKNEREYSPRDQASPNMNESDASRVIAINAHVPGLEPSRGTQSASRTSLMAAPTRNHLAAEEPETVPNLNHSAAASAAVQAIR